MGKFIDLKAADGFTFPAYVAEPQGKATGSVVVLQEIFGVNSHIQDVTNRLAAQGYFAIAPATFERVEKGVDLGYNGDTTQAGIALKSAVTALPGAGVMQDVAAAIAYAAQSGAGKVAVMGFCWGGQMTWHAATSLPGLSAAVCYYGGGMTTPEDIALKPLCPTMAHFGDQDHFISLDSVEAFKKAHPEVTVHIYPADHGFNCDQRGSYDAPAAKLAMERTLAFLAANLA